MFPEFSSIPCVYLAVRRLDGECTVNSPVLYRACIAMRGLKDVLKSFHRNDLKKTNTHTYTPSTPILQRLPKSSSVAKRTVQRKRTAQKGILTLQMKTHFTASELRGGRYATN